MEDTESVVCSHCDTPVHRQWLVDHVKEELLSDTLSHHCSLCSDILQTLTDLLCALHQYRHLKTPVINITCSRCSFKAGSVETFVEHLQMWCETERDGIKPGPCASPTPTEHTGYAYRECYLPNNDSKEDKGEGGTCEKTVGTRDEKMGDWDGQQFQQMMSLLLTDTSGKGHLRKSPKQDVGQYSKVTIDTTSVCENDKKETGTQQGEGMMKCEHCDYVTPDKDGLLRHQIKHIGKKPFVCGHCNKAFARKCELKRHELRHAGIKSAMCHICGDTFQQNQSLVHHIQAQHHGLKVYKCDQCPFESGYYSSLLTHRRAYHTNEKPYRCEFEGCNYASASTSQLRVHRRKHTGEKPFKCTMCNYASADSAGLRKHVRRHSNLRPYKCNMCDFDTKHSFLLRKHKENAHNVMTNCKYNPRENCCPEECSVMFSVWLCHAYWTAKAERP
ncbi:hypothetical protein Bbelb_403970 [Branchiostoma belcheri]|nr:hypothetical protein Bbelb_403970 [Branchiostoma belcheri]